MKPTNKSMKRLLIMTLTGLLFCTNSSNAQEKKCLTVAEYAQMILDLAEGTKAIEDLKMDSVLILKLKAEIDRKENVIVKTLDQRNACYDEVKLLKDDISIKETILASRQKTITDLQRKAKPKRFGFGPYVGYGVSTGKPGATFGLAVTYNVLRW